MNKVTIGTSKGLAPDEIQIEIGLRGTPKVVIDALAHGLPRDALEALRSALEQELRRGPSRALSRRRTRPTG